MIIRDYQPEDKKSLIEFLEKQSDELIFLDPFNRKRKDGYGEFSLKNLLEQNKETGKILVAEEAGEVVGYASGWIKHIEEFEELTGGPAINGMLDNLYVKPEYRKKGIATALVKALEQFFKGNHCQLIWLNVYSENSKAVNLYSNLGYTPSSTTLIKKLC